jgi:hypothetical protein
VLLRNVVLAGGAGSSEVLDVAGSQALYLEGTSVSGEGEGGGSRCPAPERLTQARAAAPRQLLPAPAPRPTDTWHRCTPSSPSSASSPSSSPPSSCSGGYYAGALLANVQYAHIQASRLGSADNCLIARGGCAYLLLNANDVGPCTTAGLVLGDTSAFQGMAPPWHQYDVYAARATNNVVSNVNGGWRRPAGPPAAELLDRWAAC